MGTRVCFWERLDWDHFTSQFAGTGIELALFRASGFSRTFITSLIFREYAILLAVGTLIGGTALHFGHSGDSLPQLAKYRWAPVDDSGDPHRQRLAWIFSLAQSGIRKIRMCKNEE
jgi:hypothetical protein